MIPNTKIDQAKAYDILSLIPTQLKKVSTHEGGEYAGPCPFCGGTDRFRVWPATGRYWCRGSEAGGNGCGAKGDVIDFVMQSQGVTFEEAIDILAGGGPATVVAPTNNKPVKRKHKPHTAWERRASELIKYAMDHLDPEGLAYLETRGIDRMTAFGAGLGWNPSSMKDNGERWGIDGEVYIAAGLVIPYEHAGKVTAINIRTKDSYRIVKGSTLSIHGERIIYKPVPWPTKNKVILFEGEFDAIAAWQALPDSGVGTGSIPAGNLKSLDQLGDRECYVCFDTDQAGIKAGTAAENLGSKAINLPEQFKDFNQFLQAVGDAAAGAFLLEAITQ